MAYLKPQAPLMQGADYIYPVTTSDQVVMGDGNRLNAVGVYLQHPDEGESTDVTGNNADTLGGIAATSYALKDENEYRFVKTIELSSAQAGVMQIDETFDTEYAGLIVIVSGASTSVKDKVVYCKAGLPPNNTVGGTGGNINEPTKAARFMFRKLDGTWESFAHIGYTWGESVMTGQVSANSMYGYDSNNSDGYIRIVPSITFMSVYTSDSSGFPAGTKVTIFGKEA